MSATILTTLACNMKCVYCFEQGVDSNLSMEQEMAAKVCNWLTNKMDKVRPRELFIVFFGGEPLLNLEAVKFISFKHRNHNKRASSHTKAGGYINTIWIEKGKGYTGWRRSMP